jgi:RNA recognition motif-containing protein
MNIFVGNLSYNVTEGDLRQAFDAFGQVTSANVIKDDKVVDQKALDSWKCPFKLRLSLLSQL